MTTHPGKPAKRALNPQAADARTTATDAGAAPTPRPLKPRKGLFLGLVAVFTLWVAALLVMYFTTVHPNRDGGLHEPSPSQLPATG